jgi:Spy/CpxP family protein refolding chaperone
MIKQAGLSGSNAGFEAHHLLAKQFASKFGVQQGEIISVALTPKWHRGSGGEKLIAEGKNINDAIEKQLKAITGSRTQRGAVSSATPEQIWQAHRNVYEGMGQNSWAKSVYDKYISPLGIPYK